MGSYIVQNRITTGPQYGGPGTHMRRRLQLMGVPSCGACKAMAEQMDEWGPSGCREHREEIIDGVWDRAWSFYSSLNLERKATLLQYWDAGIFTKAKAVASALFSAQGTVRAILEGIIDDSIESAEKGEPIQSLSLLGFAGSYTAGDCCCHCQDGACTPAGTCAGWGKTACTTNPLTSCYCVTITDLTGNGDCACLAGSYTISNTVFTTHTWGYFAASSCDMATLVLTMDDSSNPGGCSNGCGSGANVLGINCGDPLVTACIVLCGDANPFDMSGEGTACCGCVGVQVTQGECT